VAGDRQVSPQTHYARSSDVNIAYQVVGDGPFDFVFVPGSILHLDLQWADPLLRDAESVLNLPDIGTAQDPFAVPHSQLDHSLDGLGRKENVAHQLAVARSVRAEGGGQHRMAR
jgi:hypothetical protein